MLNKLSFLILFFPLLLSAQNVFVWDYDANYNCINPDTGGEWAIQEGVVQALLSNGINPVVQTNLPADLSLYNVVFVVCGIWCYS